MILAEDGITAFQGEHYRLLLGDARETLRSLPPKSVHCVITSPPYWWKRDYQWGPKQVGLEKTPEAYVAAQLEVFAEVHRVLRDDGVLWVNIGDTFCKDSKFGGTSGSLHDYAGDQVPRSYQGKSGLTQGDLVGIPWMLAFAMRANGWVLRQENIWAKVAPMPDSVRGKRWIRCRIKIGKSERGETDTKHGVSHLGNKPQVARDGHNFDSGAKWRACPGCPKCEPNDGWILQRGNWRHTTAHEQIFMFTKRAPNGTAFQYFADGDTSKEPTTGGTHSRGHGLNPKADFELTPSRDLQPKSNSSYSEAMRDVVHTRNMRTIWNLRPEGKKIKHFAMFPPELVTRALYPSISKGGCCAHCGTQYAPMIESERIATRPGKGTKTERASQHGDSPYEKHNGTIVGNRDKFRHTTVVKVLGYRKMCRCATDETTRPIVLDCYGGSMTVGQVAIRSGAYFIGCEGSEEYIAYGDERINTPWEPYDKHKRKRKRRQRKADRKQLDLFAREGAKHGKHRKKRSKA